VTGFAGVLALVLAETVAGALAFTWVGPLWHETRRSYFTLHTVILTVLFAAPAWWAAGSGWTTSRGLWSARAAGLTLVVCGLSSLLFLVRRPAAGRVAGIAALVASAATLGAMADTGRQAFAISLFQLAAGAAFIGAAYDGLFLGHWYLTDRKLTRRPIDRATTTLLVASIVELGAIATGGFSGTPSSTAFNPLLTAGALAPWIAVGMVATTLLIAIVVRATLKGQRASAVQAATGFYYLAVVTAFTAEIAVKTRFLPG
jgi:hypothetical protein